VFRAYRYYDQILVDKDKVILGITRVSITEVTRLKFAMHRYGREKISFF
jgi:hypothetical protein